jgi:hypothetical protein
LNVGLKIIIEDSVLEKRASVFAEMPSGSGELLNAPTGPTPSWKAMALSSYSLLNLKSTVKVFPLIPVFVDASN